ncbi:MAG: hypothetical protein J7513_00680 [Solirubrobacteraceae bacterium]|nr:hypothetical protein [Solirubrobacteraceae bacterium]
MRTVIDVTPVSSRTTGPAEDQPAPPTRWEIAKARLKLRLMVFAFVVTVAAIVALIATIGFFILLVLVGTAAVVAVAGWVRSLFGGKPAAGPPARRWPR